MNIFFLGLDPRVAAKYHCDKYIVITTKRLNQKLRNGDIVKNLRGFSTDQKVILAICVTVIITSLIFVSYWFIDSRISSYWRMQAFNKCLANNELLVEKSKSTFPPYLNQCRY